jgi:two-component system, LuxR family, response regulator FixJ
MLLTEETRMRMESIARTRILLVEDDAAVRRALQLLLTGEGYDVRSYGSGTGLARDPEALAAACLVADLMIPERDAVELLQDLRGAGWAGKAILVSGFLTSERTSRAYDAGYDRVLAKPLREAVLTNEIANLLGPGRATAD